MKQPKPGQMWKSRRTNRRFLVVDVSPTGAVDVRHQKFGKLMEVVRHCHTLHHWKVLVAYDDMFMEIADVPTASTVANSDS